MLNREYIIKRTHITLHQRRKFIQEIIELSLLVSGEGNLRIVHSDPDDDKFLHAALEVHADYIVSGDHHLLDLKEYGGIKIVTPNDFLPILEKRSQEGKKKVKYQKFLTRLIPY